jgi:hypothetical protein
MNDWSVEETDDPVYADRRNFYKVEKWSRDGLRVELMLYAGNNLDKARRIFERASKHRPRIRLTLRQRMRVIERVATAQDDALTWKPRRHRLIASTWRVYCKPIRIMGSSPARCSMNTKDFSNATRWVSGLMAPTLPLSMKKKRAELPVSLRTTCACRRNARAGPVAHQRRYARIGISR